MCQFLLTCPASQLFLMRAMPLILILFTIASVLVITEITKAYANISFQHKPSELKVIPTGYSILMQAQEIVEKSEAQQLIEV